MPRSIANLISDFSGPATPEGHGIGVLRRVRQVVEPDQPPPSSLDPQAESIQSIEARVRAEERAAAREQIESALKAERDRYREELTAERKIWTESEALQISTQLATAMVHLEHLVSEKAARILMSVIPEGLRQSAIAEFNEALASIVQAGPLTLLRVTGPEDLLDAVRARMTLREGLIEFIPSNTVEVMLVAEGTTVQTQLEPWSERLLTLLKAEQIC